MNRKKLIVIAGPTAVGKTKLSVELAKRISGEIISADSMQVYRGMDIGSAKITAEEMDGVRHHLIDVLEPDQPFDVVQFQSLARHAVGDITSRGHIPILAGGTGFYIQSVVYDIDFTENNGDDEFRRMLEKEGDPLKLHRMLMEADPDSAAAIHPNNVRRTIRALEFLHQTGGLISEHNRRQRQKQSPYDFCYFAITQDRAKVYERINLRVDDMVKRGLEDEVRRLKAQGALRGMTSMKGLGYAEMLSYLDGEIGYDEAIRLIKRNTRRFAKRQITWLKRERDVIWIDRGDYGDDDERILSAMLGILKEHGICD